MLSLMQLFLKVDKRNFLSVYADSHEREMSIFWFPFMIMTLCNIDIKLTVH